MGDTISTSFIFLILIAPVDANTYRRFQEGSPGRDVQNCGDNQSSYVKCWVWHFVRQKGWSFGILGTALGLGTIEGVNQMAVTMAQHLVCLMDRWSASLT